MFAAQVDHPRHSVSDLIVSVIMTKSTFTPHDWSCLDLHLPPSGWNPFSYFQKRTYLKPSSKHIVRKSEYCSYRESPAFDKFDRGDMIQDCCYLCGETRRLEREWYRERHGGGGAEWRHAAVLMRSYIHNTPITLTVVMLFWCYRLNQTVLTWDEMWWLRDCNVGSNMRRADCAGTGQWASERRVRAIPGHDNKWQGGLGLGSQQSSAVQ